MTSESWVLTSLSLSLSRTPKEMSESVSKLIVFFQSIVNVTLPDGVLHESFSTRGLVVLSH